MSHNARKKCEREDSLFKMFLNQNFTRNFSRISQEIAGGTIVPILSFIAVTHTLRFNKNRATYPQQQQTRTKKRKKERSVTFRALLASN